MKTKLIILGLLSAAMWLPAQVATNTYNGNGAPILDGNPVGLTELLPVSGPSGSISNIQVTLDITGGFNGDLYAYLVGPQGQFAVLLNRVGVTDSNPFGYGNAGFAITLDASSANIHGYGDGYSKNGLGQVTGTWGADGRNIDPQSPGATFYDASTAASLSVFQNTDANGGWTLFIADLADGGGQSTLVTWELTVVTVPEPQTWTMLGGGLAVFGLCRSRRGFKR